MNENNNMVKPSQVSIVIHDFKIKNNNAIEVSIICMYLEQRNVL